MDSRASAPIELWNVADGACLVTGAQRTFNVLGRITPAGHPLYLAYSLNGAPARVVHARGPRNGSLRLQSTGDFSIDRIRSEELLEENELVLQGAAPDGTSPWRRVVRFSARSFPTRQPWQLQLEPGQAVGEVGQVVEGRWGVEVDEHGRPGLTILPSDAGLDRVVLLSPPVLAPAYDVEALIRVDRFTRSLHNVGLVFDWRGHPSGDGSDLPREWTTGLGYYYSNSPGLRIRLGRDVHQTVDGERRGDIVLAASPYSTSRQVARVAARKLSRGRLGLPGLPTRRLMKLHLKVRTGGYELTVWPAGRSRPHAAQVVAERPHGYLEPGACGIIAHYCAVRVYEFEVRVPSDARGRR